MRNKLLVAAAFVLGNLLTGCAYSVDRINLHYVPQEHVQPIAASHGIAVEVRVKDVRTQMDRVGAKGVANQAAAIVSNTDVATLLQGAIETELRQRGYTVTSANVLLVGDLSNFVTTWEQGVWSGSAHGSCQLMVKIKDKSGNLLFSEIVSGQATKKGVQVTSGANAKVVLEMALQDAMNRLFGMEELYEAIGKANTNRTTDVASVERP